MCLGAHHVRAGAVASGPDTVQRGDERFLPALVEETDHVRDVAPQDVPTVGVDPSGRMHHVATGFGGDVEVVHVVAQEPQ